MSAKSGPTKVSEITPVWADADSVEVMVKRGDLDTFSWATLKLALRNALIQVTGTQSNTYEIQGDGGEQWGKPEAVFSVRVINPLVNDLSVKRMRKLLDDVAEEFGSTIVLTFGRRRVF
jgi:hypothetical protein